MILAIDSSQSSGSIAISDQNRLVYTAYFDISITHSETLMPQIDHAIKFCGYRPEDIEKLLISIGPGSFTGLRIGLATAKGIAFGLGIPVIPFGTLQMIAFGVKDWGYEIFVALDARMKEVYYASFDDALREICPVAIAPPEQIVEIYPAGAILIGSAAGVIAPLLDKKGIPYKMAGIMSHLPSAVNLIGLEQLCPGNPGYDFDRLAELEPLYIRESSAQIKHQKMEQTK